MSTLIDFSKTITYNGRQIDKPAVYQISSICDTRDILHIKYRACDGNLVTSNYESVCVCASERIAKSISFVKMITQAKIILLIEIPQYNNHILACNVCSSIFDEVKQMKSNDGLIPHSTLYTMIMQNSPDVHRYLAKAKEIIGANNI